MLNIANTELKQKILSVVYQMVYLIQSKIFDALTVSDLDRIVEIKKYACLMPSANNILDCKGVSQVDPETRIKQGGTFCQQPLCPVLHFHHSTTCAGMRIPSIDIPLPLRDNFYFVSCTPKELEQMHTCSSSKGALPVRFAAGGSWRAVRPPSIVFNPHQKKQQLREASVTTYRFYTEGTESKLTEWRLHEFSSRNSGFDQVRSEVATLICRNE